MPVLQRIYSAAPQATDAGTISNISYIEVFRGMVSRRSMSLFHRTYRPADSGRDGRQVMTGLTAATFPSPSNYEEVSRRLGCRLPVLIRGLHSDRQRAEGAGV